jgi:hypothetical protein
MLQQVADLHPDVTVFSKSPIARGVHEAQGSDYEHADADPVVKHGCEALFKALLPDTEHLVLVSDIPTHRDPGLAVGRLPGPEHLAVQGAGGAHTAQPGPGGRREGGGRVRRSWGT